MKDLASEFNIRSSAILDSTTHAAFRVTEHSEELFDPAVWKETLIKFSTATGLTVSLYDEHVNLRGSLTTSNPIGDRLLKGGFWDEGGPGFVVDASIARECLVKEHSIYAVQFEMFAHLAIPILIDSKVVAIFVMGWIPERFADPVTCDFVSKKIGAPPMEIWQLIRMQQPVSREKLVTYARMLETFAVPLIQQLMLQIEDRRRARRSKIISQAAIAFAEATTESQICSGAFASLRSLVPASAISIDLLRSKERSEEVMHYEQRWIPGEVSPSTTSTLQRQLTIPIPSLQERPLGNIGIAVPDHSLSEDSIDALRTIAGQVGIALQKVHLIQTLEAERSALKAANAQLQHLHKMKDEFLATISHELRTPLNAILGWAQILKEEGMNAEDFETAISTIERNAKNQSHLIEDLLDVSRIISGKMILQREDIEATTLLKDTLATVFPMTEARRQKLHVQVSSSAIHLKGDATRITQIFWNLLSNASKFTPEGGDISVVLETAGHYFRLEVSDSGKGISSDFLPHLFDRFSQADASFTRRHGGLGLGLAIVRHLVELHGGTVTASSGGEGKGATFTVFLPQNTTDEELDTARSLSQFADGSTLPRLKLKDIKILVIDDEPDALRLTRFVLERCGALIQIADSAEQGFQKFREWAPNILISDLSMPGESGYDLIRRVRRLGRVEGGEMPAIALTALAGPDQRELALSAGYNLHLPKPLDPNLLTESILSLLERSKAYEKALGAPSEALSS